MTRAHHGRELARKVIQYLLDDFHARHGLDLVLTMLYAQHAVLMGSQRGEEQEDEEEQQESGGAAAGGGGSGSGAAGESHDTTDDMMVDVRVKREDGQDNNGQRPEEQEQHGERDQSLTSQEGDGRGNGHSAYNDAYDRYQALLVEALQGLRYVWCVCVCCMCVLHVCIACVCCVYTVMYVVCLVYVGYGMIFCFFSFQTPTFRHLTSFPPSHILSPMSHPLPPPTSPPTITPTTSTPTEPVSHSVTQPYPSF